MDSNNGMNSTEVSDIVTVTSGMTGNFIILCHLYAFLKWMVSEESIGPNITTIKPDVDINSNSDPAFIFSSADCRVYDTLTGYGYGQCATQKYNYDRDLYGMLEFTNCFPMTKMGAIENCFNISLGNDKNTKDKNAMLLV